MELKGKEKIHSRDGQHGIVQTLVGMANKWGGTVIIGVEDGGEDRLRTFDSDSEAKRDLTDYVRSSTEPDLSKQLSVSFDRLDSDHRVLRIDVSRTEYDLYKIDERGIEGYVPFTRVGDTTRQMTPEDGIEFQQNRSQYSGFSQPDQFEYVSLPTVSETDIRSFDSPDHRFVTVCEKRSQPIFGVEAPGFQGPISYELSSRVDVRSLQDLKSMFEAAVEHLSIDRDFSCGYSIHQGDRVHCGKGVNRFLDDVANIQSVVSRMLGGHPREVGDEVTHLNDIRATAILGAGCYFGFLMTQFYWKRGISKARVRLFLRDIPFGAEELSTFFSEVSGNPKRYRQRSGVQKYVFKGELDLHNPNPIQFGFGDSFIDFVEVDNPFYGKQEDVGHVLERPIPAPLLTRLCSINRIPFRVVDGTTDPENTEFQMERLEVMPVDRPTDPFFIQAECEAM